MQREKTNYRHMTNDGLVIRVTKENGMYFIGNTNERAENKMIHHRVSTSLRQSGITRMTKKSLRAYRQNNDSDIDFGDYAHTSEDL